MRHTEDIVYFDFRVIKAEDGTEVINRTLRTPMDALTLDQQMEYMEIHNALAASDALEKKQKTEEAKQRKFTYRFKMALMAAIA